MIKTFTFIGLLFFVFSVHAGSQENPEQSPYELQTFYPEPSLDEVNRFKLEDLLSGSSLELRWQIDENASGRTSNRIAIRPRLNLTIPLTNRMRLKMQTQTGSRYGSGYDRLVSLDGNEARPLDTMAIRRLYIQYDLSENSKVQVGAIPTGSPWTETRPFSLDSDGWIDGLRVALKDVYDQIDQVHIVVGQLDPSANANFFNRNFDPTQMDFVQITVSGELNSRLSYLLEGTHLGVADESFARLDLDLKIDDWTNSIIEKLRTEFVIDAETGEFTGVSTGFARSIGPVFVEVGAIRNNRSDAQRSINNGIFREAGDSTYLILQYKFGESNQWRLSQRCRVCVNDDTCTSKYRCDTTLRHKF